MNKDALIYTIIILACILVTAVVFAISYVRNNEDSGVVDTLLVGIPEYIPIDTQMSEQMETHPQRSFIDELETDRRTFLHRMDAYEEEELDPYEQEYLSLVRQLRALFGTDVVEEEVEEEEIEEEVEEEEEIDLGPTREEELEMIILTMTAQIDSLQNVINNNVRESNRLRFNTTLIENDMTIQKNINESLKNRITILEIENELLKNPIIEEIEEIEELDYRQLARIFNNMDASRVAQILQTMPAETSVNILRTMNQRRIAQVMSALPPRITTQYSELLLK